MFQRTKIKYETLSFDGIFDLFTFRVHLFVISKWPSGHDPELGQPTMDDNELADSRQRSLNLSTIIAEIHLLLL